MLCPWRPSIKGVGIPTRIATPKFECRMFVVVFRSQAQWKKLKQIFQSCTFTHFACLFGLTRFDINGMSGIQITEPLVSIYVPGSVPR